MSFSSIAVVEGTVGGVVGLLVGALIFYGLRNERRTELDLLMHVIVALLAGMFVAGVAYKAVEAPRLFAETVVSGLLTVVMYALVALGFVLIFKASGVFNFAQGVMALFAGLTLVGLMTGTMPITYEINVLPTWFLNTSLVVFPVMLVAHAGQVIYRRANGRSASGGVPIAAIATAGVLVVGTALLARQGIDVRPFKMVVKAAWAMPVWLAIVVTVGVMALLAILVERLVLRHLVNQEQIILFMATLGLAYLLEGAGDILWGSDVKTLDLGLPFGGSETIERVTGLYVEKLELVAAVVATVLVVVLAIFFQKTRIGRALRAVADDHQAALSVGISLRTIWVIVWTVSGVVALVAGVMWGSKSGIQFSLSLIALKALPVLILGGFESIPGAIIGGLIIGLGEKLAEVFFGPLVGGAIENWFAYVLALMFLLVRPQGLFGEKIIERI
ncbi:MAG: branched-chain amino acid ABC transporter permease [Hyphomicrobiaceae bacterium]